jgi:hypothetical protein
VRDPRAERTLHTSLQLFVLSLACALPAAAEVLGPYAADAYTLHLYHFDEPQGELIHDYGIGTPVDLVTYEMDAGAASYSGFGTTYTQIGDWADTVSRHQSTELLNNSHFQGTDGAFTIEAIFRTSQIDPADGKIVERDSADNSGRNWSTMVQDGEMRFSNVGNNNGDGPLHHPIPTTGPDAFVPDEWFHYALTYTGVPNTPANLKMYFTRLREDAAEASLLAVYQLEQSIPLDEYNYLTVGNRLRKLGRGSLYDGRIDEIRISSIAREPDDFLFGAEAPPPPAPAPVPTLGGLGWALAASLALIGGWLTAVASRRPSRGKPT